MDPKIFPDAIVEAAASAIWTKLTRDERFDLAPKADREAYRDAAVAALTASINAPAAKGTF